MVTVAFSEPCSMVHPLITMRGGPGGTFSIAVSSVLNSDEQSQRIVHPRGAHYDGYGSCRSERETGLWGTGPNCVISFVVGYDITPNEVPSPEAVGFLEYRRCSRGAMQAAVRVPALVGETKYPQYGSIILVGRGRYIFEGWNPPASPGIPPPRWESPRLAVARHPPSRRGGRGRVTKARGG